MRADDREDVVVLLVEVVDDDGSGEGHDANHQNSSGPRAAPGQLRLLLEHSDAFADESGFARLVHGDGEAEVYGISSWRHREDVTTPVPPPPPS